MIEGPWIRQLSRAFYMSLVFAAVEGSLLYLLHHGKLPGMMQRGRQNRHLRSEKGQSKYSRSSFNNPSVRTTRSDCFAVACGIIYSGDVPVVVSIDPGEEESPEDLGAPPSRCINGRYHFMVRIGREVAVVVGDLPKAVWF